MSSVVEETGNEIESASTDDFYSRASNVIELLTGQIAGAVKSADGYVRSNPWVAAGAVAVAAVAAGVLLSRGPRRRIADDGASEVAGG